LSAADLEAGVGLGVIDQPAPFDVSTSVLVFGAAPEPPTATQFVSVGHDTPASALFATGRLGLATIVQPEPFHPPLDQRALITPPDRKNTASALLHRDSHQHARVRARRVGGSP